MSQARLSLFRCHHSLLNLLLLLKLLFADERADDANLFVDVLIKVEAVLLGRAELHEVVIKRFLADFDFLGSVLKRHLDKDAILVEASIEESPQTYLLNHCLNGPLLDARLVVTGRRISPFP